MLTLRKLREEEKYTPIYSGSEVFTQDTLTFTPQTHNVNILLR